MVFLVVRMFFCMFVGVVFLKLSFVSLVVGKGFFEVFWMAGFIFFCFVGRISFWTFGVV